MSDLKEQLIRIGARDKALRPHIRPVLAELEKEADEFFHIDFAMEDFAKGLATLIRQQLSKLPIMDIRSVDFYTTREGVGTTIDVIGLEGEEIACWIVVNKLSWTPSKTVLDFKTVIRVNRDNINLDNTTHSNVQANTPVKVARIAAQHIREKLEAYYR